MEDFLYKVSPPRADMMFEPTTFWHTPDWESSSTNHKKGYIEDAVLFLGDFDEVNIHLLPRRKSVRVRSSDASSDRLADLGLDVSTGKTAYIFVDHKERKSIEGFTPTVYKFKNEGFENVRKGEYVTWESQEAISSETLTMKEAIRRWKMEICYVEDIDEVIAVLERNEIYCDVQT